MDKVTTVYWSGGQIYKEEFRPEHGTAFAMGTAGHSSNQYFKANTLNHENLCNWAGVKRSNGNVRVKRWQSTRQLNELMGMSGGVDISQFNTTSHAALWLAVGRYEGDDSEYELYFHIGNPWKLKDIAEHYALPDPLTDEQKRDIEQNPMVWRERILKLDGVTPTPVVVGSVAFKDEQPVRLKAYQFHHPVSN